MNRLLVSLCTLVAVLLTGCDGTDPLEEMVPELPADCGEIAVEKNGQVWRPCLRGSLELGAAAAFMTLSMHLDPADDRFDEKLVIDFVPQQPGTYALQRAASYRPTAHFATQQGNVVHDRFQLDPSAANQIVIDRIDAATGTVAGRFSMRLTVEERHSNQLPDTLRFVSSRFQTALADTMIIVPLDEGGPAGAFPAP